MLSWRLIFKRRIERAFSKAGVFNFLRFLFHALQNGAVPAAYESCIWLKGCFLAWTFWEVWKNGGFDESHIRIELAETDLSDGQASPRPCWTGAFSA